MIPPKIGLLLIGLLLFCTAAAASEPPRITVTAGTGWLVAGGAESAAITAVVTDGAGIPMKNINVLFSCDPAMGSIKNTGMTTDAEGKAKTFFKPGTKSGTAAITATVKEASASCSLEIDHATPYRIASLDYESEITAGSTTSITIRLEDRYRNPVDSRKTAETARFLVGSPTGSAGIHDGSAYTSDATIEVNATGYLTAPFQADLKSGTNIIYADFPGAVADHYILITGLANAVPASIDCAVTPDLWVPADGASRFSLVYTLKDLHGNPAGGRSLTIAALPGEDRTVTTNSNGLATITYGPRDTTGTVTITATAVDDQNVTCSTTLSFTSTDPVEMILTAGPQSMPSLDVKPDQTAAVRAKVMDIKGNPVPGETVAFTVQEIDTTGYAATAAPSLLAAEAATDADGYATVYFRPGAFTLDKNHPDYSPTATGTCTVTAAWEGVTRSIPLTWKNYPYLSISTTVDPETLEINGSVNVTVTLKGDGWALQPDPIDVVLVIDRSGSMGGTDISPTRLAAAKTAAIDFIEQMNLENDRVGLVSFSWSAAIDQDLTGNEASIVSAINALKPDGGTNMRRAFYEAIRMLKTTGRNDAVKAVVLMSDGDWNLHGSPLAIGPGYPDNDPYLSSHHKAYPETFAGYPWSGYVGTYDFSAEKYEWYHDLPEPRGTAAVSATWYREYPYNAEFAGTICTDGRFTNQNMSVYANSGADDEKVRVYTIGFVSNLDPRVEEDLTTLSRSTGATYTWAKNTAELQTIYRRIAGELKTEAGVDTTMDLSFQDIEVNDTPEPGREVFAYRHIEGISTRITSWIDNETGHHVIVQPHTEDQTADWEDDQVLHFKIDTVRLHQTWTATYTLKTLMSGNINIFGPGSVISFNGGSDNLELPDTFITVVPDLNITGLDAAALEVRDLQRVGSGPVTDFLQVGWTINYTGSDTAGQHLYYADDGGRTWNHFHTMPQVSAGERTQAAALDIRALPAGYYTIRVHAQAPDAPDAIAELPAPIPVGIIETAKIRIE
ncbi:von Willebrand factor type A [Methanofollis liminatans DSM 4140]|uniref:von Willebrand factor type A n=1 Tax=Methanofollis liminatans DSM 4140 TaxID=28892 RepID=J1L3I8_9EURY|nr:VWA domain-containing protein [Methanofollis liminatans]EJG07652.1 von Willebrand factor type A [Methanofollis liminatans DSM 4140]